MKNIFIPIFLILNIISISIYGRSPDIPTQTDSNNYSFKYVYADVNTGSFTLDELWEFSKISSTISQQLMDLNWHYDEFRSYVHLGNYSGTQVGLVYITLNKHADIQRAMMDFTYQLNNALNADQTANLADMLAKANISVSDFMTACDKMESAAVIDQLMVAAEMKINMDAPFILTNMVQAYQSGEFNLLYLQNWIYTNYISGTIISEQKDGNLPTVFDEVKTTATYDTDSFIQTLHNRDVSLTMALVAPDKEFDDFGKFQPCVVERILTSVNVDLLENTYPENLLIENLVKLLDDPDKDWYANLLLYNLTGKFPFISSENDLRINTRTEWLKPMEVGGYTYKEADVRMWEKYFASLNKSQKN